MSRLASASRADTNTRAIFVLAAKKPPYNVYGNPFYDYAGYGNVFSVDANGAIERNIQNYEYAPNSGVHGMVFDPTETYLYSADLRANKIWTHKKEDDGRLTLVDCIDAPSPDDHPRWVAIHPSGAYLYVLMEAGNRLGVYVIDEHRHVPVFTRITYPLIPAGTAFSPPPNIIYANAMKKISLTDHPRTASTKQIPRRCRLHIPQWKVSLRHHPWQFIRHHRLHQCIQARTSRQH